MPQPGSSSSGGSGSGVGGSSSGSGARSTAPHSSAADTANQHGRRVHERRLLDMSSEDLARRVRRAERGGTDGDEQGPGADAAAFVAFDRLTDELDELFVGKDNPLLDLRQNETPFELLPVIPPKQLLPALLSLVRTGLPTPFRFLNHLTRTAIKTHLRPFMWMVHAFGTVCTACAPTLRIGYRLSLRGQAPYVPWPEPRSGEGGIALLLVKAAFAAMQLWYDGMQCAYWVAERALCALDDQACCTAAQAELAAVGVADPAAALADLRYACHETCIHLLWEHGLVLEKAGQGEELRVAVARHSTGLLALRPDLAAAWALTAQGHHSLGNFYMAQVVALRGLPVADAARDAWHGTYLRLVLAGSISMAGEAATPGKLRVGVLRRLIGEAGLLERRYRSWTPETEGNPGLMQGAAAVSFFAARGSDQDRIDCLPNDAVEPCLSSLPQEMMHRLPVGEHLRRCGGCGQEIEGRPKRCSRCWMVPYHDQACQKKHWLAGHQQQCQDVSCGGLDWAAEAAAAEAGLAAWEEEEEALTPGQRRTRLALEYLRRVMQQAASVP